MKFLTALPAAAALMIAPAAISNDHNGMDHQNDSAMQRNSNSMTWEHNGDQANAQEVNLDTIVVYSTGDYNPAYLASAWLGESVYDRNNEEIGDVTDLVITKDGGLEAAVINVGGLWGLYADEVAVPIEQFYVTSQDDDEPRLQIAYTESEVEAIAG
jgi:sporulation protein YlmC with PRC-barrel domain